MGAHDDPVVVQRQHVVATLSQLGAACGDHDGALAIAHHRRQQWQGHIDVGKDRQTLNQHDIGASHDRHGEKQTLALVHAQHLRVGSEPRVEATAREVDEVRKARLGQHGLSSNRADVSRRCAEVVSDGRVEERRVVRQQGDAPLHQGVTNVDPIERNEPGIGVAVAPQHLKQA
ncbi:unannotated protein [freshwater metagenome]|uniref:Unannotated protein n=1 Tax=freshwater metagenome TaxID=449393 RepID=A0A6J7R2E1_9ZZZZ